MLKLPDLLTYFYNAFPYLCKYFFKVIPSINKEGTNLIPFLYNKTIPAINAVIPKITKPIGPNAKFSAVPKAVVATVATL